MEQYVCDMVSQINRCMRVWNREVVVPVLLDCFMRIWEAHLGTFMAFNVAAWKGVWKRIYESRVSRHKVCVRPACSTVRLTLAIPASLWNLNGPWLAYAGFCFKQWLHVKPNTEHCEWGTFWHRALGCPYCHNALLPENAALLPWLDVLWAWQAYCWHQVVDGKDMLASFHLNF